MKKLINIFYNDNPKSIDAFKKTKRIFEKKNFEVSTDFNKEAELNVCIGGDGAFIRAVHKTEFTQIPFVGINTGTLGFFQEISEKNIGKFADDYVSENFEPNKINLLGCEIKSSSKDKIVLKSKCINEFVLKSNSTEIIHLDIFIDGNHLETFAGDGLIISTPYGSTAYNMSAGGSILYPNLKGYQLTPLAPIFSKVYRTISNSIVIPDGSTLKIVPRDNSHKKVSFIADGIEKIFEENSYFEFKKSSKNINRLVFDKNWYWINMKDKFL